MVKKTRFKDKYDDKTQGVSGAEGSGAVVQFSVGLQLVCLLLNSLP